MIPTPPEKLGSFYLGAQYDLAKQTPGNELVNYDSRDLTTHAVCVGMTGSGKTGLCIDLLEEAAIDQVPAIIIDPKGDMTNLLLQFENMEAKDFEKWVNADDASRKGMSLSDYATATAAKWTAGLAEWGQGKERIQLLQKSVDYTIYTPGSDAGVPINILGSFAAPGIDFDSDAEMLRERIQGMVAALLGMINSTADPSRSREGILLATLFEHYWRKNEDLDLTKLIIGVQKPPITQLGVFDIDTFFPEKDRFELAMDFNTLVASPQFQYWLQGDALDIDKLYFTANGQPRHSIFYIAHLSESERMFFVTLLLNSLISWMRRQSGTTSLRSLLYFDEIFGYFPPAAQPPSKKPLLTILKQARAFGVGAVLVTQNPVDIDYKGLSNAGTWFIGKLQTDRDKMRVLEGLEGAIAEAGTKTKTNFSQIISSLSARVFLMHNVHDDHPVVFQTRWAMSYLCGPLTRPQIKELMAAKKEKISEKTSTASTTQFKATTVGSASSNKLSVPPSVDPAIDQRYFTVRKSATMAERELSDSPLSLLYEPMALLTGKVRLVDSKKGIDVVQDIALLTAPPDDFGRIDWENGQKVNDWEKALVSRPDHPDNTSVQYDALPGSFNSAKELTKVEKEFSDWLYQNHKLDILEHQGLKENKKPEESDEAFLMRVRQSAREKRDEEIDALQDKYETRLNRIEDRIRQEERQLAAAEEEAKDRKTAEWIGVAETLFSVFSGRRRSISTVTSKTRMRRKANQKVEANQEDLAELEQDFAELQKELQQQMDEVSHKWDNATNEVTITSISPRRTDIKVDSVRLVWYPYWVATNGQRVVAQ